MRIRDASILVAMNSLSEDRREELRSPSHGKNSRAYDIVTRTSPSHHQAQVRFRIAMMKISNNRNNNGSTLILNQEETWKICDQKVFLYEKHDIIHLDKRKISQICQEFVKIVKIAQNHNYNNNKRNDKSKMDILLLIALWQEGI
ncbi:hypothetical protein ACJX0J_028759 [Zea mays]